MYEKIHEVVTGVLSSRIHPTKDFVANLVEIQLAYINTNHPEFTDRALVKMLKDAHFPAEEKEKKNEVNEFHKMKIEDNYLQSEANGVNGVTPSIEPPGMSESSSSILGFKIFGQNNPASTSTDKVNNSPSVEDSRDKLTRTLTAKEKRDSSIVGMF